MSQIEIFQSADNAIEIQVMLENETVWLSQKQMAQLFDKDSDTIGLHLKNIFTEEELLEKATTELFSVVQTEGKRKVTRQISFYNLDAIISVGYRVNSKKGTQFRQWATQRLKEHLVKGYTINETRIKQLKDGFFELEQTVRLIHQSSQSDELKTHEAKGLLDIIANYTQSFILLNQFDSNNLDTNHLNANITYEIHQDEAIGAIEELKRQLINKNEASELFGNRKDKNFAGLLGNVVQSFGGEYVYCR